MQFWCAEKASEPEAWWNGQAIEGPVASGRWRAVLPDKEWWLMDALNIRWRVGTTFPAEWLDCEMAAPPATQVLRNGQHSLALPEKVSKWRIHGLRPGYGASSISCGVG